MNFADSDEMGRHLKTRGFAHTDDPTTADAILVNTCTVRELAEHKAMSFLGRLKEWKGEHPSGMIIVTGCAAERAKESIKKRFPYVDLIVGAKDIEKFPEELDAVIARRPKADVPFRQSKLSTGRTLPFEPLSKEYVAISADYETVSRNSPVDDVNHGNGIAAPSFNYEIRDAELAVTGSRSSIVQYVTIMRGCNYNCSYCIVPAVRGREIYRSMPDILRDVGIRVREGAKEIWLLGQTVNSYRRADDDTAYDFADLLRDVALVPGVERIRFTSPHPYYLSPKLIRAMAETKKVCEHIHLPVQSGSNNMLKKMKRNYTRESYLENIRELRNVIPEISITTDIIVGFPGETKDDYQKTLSLVHEANFDSAYCFKYSPRPGTLSAEWEDDVPEIVKEERVNNLLHITDTQGMKKAQALIGTTQEVLIEEDKGEGAVRGKTRGAWRVRLKNAHLQPGQTVQARITGTHSRELHAEPLEVPGSW